MKTGKYCAWDTDLKEYASKNQFDEMSFFYEGVSVVKKDGIEFYLNSNCELFRPKEDIEGCSYKLNKFSEGLAVVGRAEPGSNDYQYSYINRDGIEVTARRYHYCQDINNGFGCVERIDSYALDEEGKGYPDGTKEGYVDRTGFEILPIKERWWEFFNGIARSKQCDAVKHENGVIYETKEDYEYIWPYKAHVTWAKLKLKGASKYHLINKTMGVIGMYDFDEVKDFSEGHAAIKVGKKWGYVNVAGKIMLDPQFDFAGDFRKGYAIVGIVENDKLKKTLIDKNFKILFPFEYEELGTLNSKRCWFKEINKFGVISLEGEVIQKPIYDNISDFEDGYAVVSIGDYAKGGHSWQKDEYVGLYGVIDVNGNKTVPLIYHWINRFANGVCGVERNGLWGLLNVKGGEIAPIKYATIYHSEEAEGFYRVSQSDGKKFYVDSQGIEYTEDFQNNRLPF